VECLNCENGSCNREEIFVLNKWSFIKIYTCANKLEDGSKPDKVDLILKYNVAFTRENWVDTRCSEKLFNPLICVASSAVMNCMLMKRS
jgi:hypothetical protein